MGRFSPLNVLDWRAAGLRYFEFGAYLRRLFGGRVQKVSIDAGFTCPNVDGSVATGGCNFCDNRSFSPSRRVPRQGVWEQIDDGIRRLKRRYKADRFLAYFQPGTNTYAPIERLRPLYQAALTHPKVVGLAIGTRPDCLPPEVVDLLAEIADRTYLSLEIGVQTTHDRSLAWMNRGHGFDVVPPAVERCRQRSIPTCAHIILGLPGENRDDMLATARQIGQLGFDAVKIHNLYAVHRTPLGDDVLAGRMRLLERDEYVRLVVDFLELLPPHCLIERLGGDAPPDYLIGPSWCLDKPSLRRAIAAEFAGRATWQGRLHQSLALPEVTAQLAAFDEPRGPDQRQSCRSASNEGQPQLS